MKKYIVNTINAKLRAGKKEFRVGFKKYWVSEKQGEKRLYCKSGLIYSIEIVNGSIDTPVLLSAVEMIF